MKLKFLNSSKPVNCKSFSKKGNSLNEENLSADESFPANKGKFSNMENFSNEENVTTDINFSSE